MLFWIRDVCSALLFLEEIKLPLRALSCKNVLLNSALCAKLSVYSTTRHLSDKVCNPALIAILVVISNTLFLIGCLEPRGTLSRMPTLKNNAFTNY